MATAPGHFEAQQALTTSLTGAIASDPEGFARLIQSAVALNIGDVMRAPTPAGVAYAYYGGGDGKVTTNRGAQFVQLVNEYLANVGAAPPSSPGGGGGIPGMAAGVSPFTLMLIGIGALLLFPKKGRR